MNYEEGEGSNLYSSMGWALTEVESVPTYLGKWGHRMLAWTVEDGQGGREPALYFIAGDAVGGGSFVSDVFVSTKTRECLKQKCGMLACLCFFHLFHVSAGAYVGFHDYVGGIRVLDRW